MTNDYLGESRSLDTHSDGEHKPSLGKSGNYSGQLWKLTMVRHRYARLLSPALWRSAGSQALAGIVFVEARAKLPPVEWLQISVMVDLKSLSTGRLVHSRFPMRVLTVFTLCLVLGLGLRPALMAQSPYDEKPRKKSKKNKKDEEPVTQVLPLPKELPSVITAETERLTFFVSPLSGKGLLTAQTREALKYLIGAAKTSTIVKLRAFVAGSGDTRRIPTLVGEVMTEKKLPLPVVSTVQVGSLGLEGAQVLFEAIAVERRAVNPQGLAFISGQVGRTLREAADGVSKAAAAAGASETLSMTCFVSSLENSPERGGMAAVVVQMRREPSPTAAECEAVARLKTAPSEAVVLLNPEGLAKSPNYSQVALVKAPRVAFSGLQLCFHTQESDAKLAFERLGKTLESGGVRYSQVFFMHTYALTVAAMEQVRAVRFGYLDKGRPPASTLLPFEGLPSLDMSFGVEVVAVVP